MSVINTTAEPRAPRFMEMILPVAIAPALAGLAFGLAAGWSVARLAAIGAALSGTLFGWPVLFWLFDTGRRGLVTRAVSGAICGAAPFVGAILSGLIGLYGRSSDLSYVRWVLRHGAPVPYFGTTPWPHFLWLAILGMICGVVTMVAASLVTRRS